MNAPCKRCDIKETKKNVNCIQENIKLDLNGHTLTTSANENVIVNSGKLEIYDSSEKIDEETGEKIAGTGKIKGSTRDSIINCVYGEI